MSVKKNERGRVVLPKSKAKAYSTGVDSKVRNTKGHTIKKGGQHSQPKTRRL